MHFSLLKNLIQMELRMSKTERHQRELEPIFSSFISNHDESNLIKYLKDNSDLPGRRANIELGKAFTLIVEIYLADNNELLWNLIENLLSYTPEKAPTNNPSEFLAFCGTWALGTIGVQVDQYYNDCLRRIRSLAIDSRWRIREAVAKAIHILLEKKEFDLINELENWVVNGDWLVMRAIATGVAEPSLLIDKKLAQKALHLHKLILNQLNESVKRINEEFKTLRKGLGYSLSVVVQAIPEEGFKFMDELIMNEDKDIRWILKENLKKNRLTKNHPSEVRVLINKLK